MNWMKKITATFLSIVILSLFGVGLVFAQQQPPGQGGTGPGQGGTGPIVLPFRIDNPLGNNTSLFGLLVSIIDNILLPIGGVLAVLAFVYSGFLYVMARGNETKIKDAHRALLYSAIGTAVLLGSWMIANVICRTVGELGGPSCQL